MNKLLLKACYLSLILIGVNSAHAFSFGSSDYYYPGWSNPYYGWPGWGVPSYGPRYYRSMPSYDRSTMVTQRQRKMEHYQELMDELADILYGKDNFDRAQAIKLARKIEVSSGEAISSHFHPNSISTYGSRTSSAIWKHREVFKANALALQSAAVALAEELEKNPTEKEGAVYLRDPFPEPGTKNARVAVSPGVWAKFNALSGVCTSCHSGFRGPEW